jgi:hypothetical protein
MAEHLELWTERTPERVARPNRAEQVVRMRETALETLETLEAPVAPRKPRRERGPFVTYLRLPWSYGDRERTDVWRRIQCRLRRHEMRGGEHVQLSGEVIFIERRCRWCGADAAHVGVARG